ncbi:hypothetical protein [Escherichia coli]|uniref:hypothetical protein n=1 Tax=Escherichia coli TaxID=562 RepID=UPI00388E3AB7
MPTTRLMPVMQRLPGRETQQKLAELEKKPVRNRTWLFFLLDEVPLFLAGWMLALTAAA